MSTTRLHVDGPLAVGQKLTLDGDRARYVGRVLRLKRGDRVVLFDGSGVEYPAVIESLGKRSAAIVVSERRPVDRESPLVVHLLQGVSRGDRMDHVLQKATELGVHRITPVLTEYTVVKLAGDRADSRLQHWRGVIASACEQCGRNQLPDIDSPTGLREILGGFAGKGGTRIVLAPGATATLAERQPVDGRVTLLIGPEGGLSDEEYDLADKAGFLATGFGPRILRTETAAIAALAALQYGYGDLA